MKKNSWSAIFVSLIAILFISIVYSAMNKIEIPIVRLKPSPTPTIPPVKISTNSATFKVLRIIDGDTIELENKQRVRYIGINTPEIHHPTKPVECFGQEAAQKNKELVEGKSVVLTKDVSETDKYGRLLRFVYLQGTPSAIFVNDYLVREGYAYATTFPPDVKYAGQFALAQRDARTNNRGLWTKCQ